MSKVHIHPKDLVLDSRGSLEKRKGVSGPDLNAWYCPDCEKPMKHAGGWAYRCEECGGFFDTWDGKDG